MPGFYLPLVGWVRSHPVLRKLARLAVLCVPDVPVTMTVPLLGRFRFSIRRHRWLLGTDCFAGHADVLGMFERLTRPGDVFYDVGANIGYYLRFIVAYLPVRHVVAFEPMRANVRLLRENVMLGRCSERVTLLAVALGEINSEELLQVDDVGDGSAVLDRISAGQAAEPRRLYGLKPKTEPVPVRRLDDLVCQANLPPPNVMKIDTEGAERIVLEGARQTLRRYRPRLAIALHGSERVRETIGLLRELGYRCFGMVRGDGQVVYQEVDASSLLANNNIVCSTDAAELRDPIQPLDFSRLCSRSGL